MYEFPDCDSEEDEDFKEQDRALKASVPFAVVGSNTVLEVAGKKIRGRQYPWGVVDGISTKLIIKIQNSKNSKKKWTISVENPMHSDFIKLRTMLISTHMQDLKDVTEDVHYENFRAQCISQISQHALRERGKLKRESGPQYESAISDTDRLLLQKDEEVLLYCCFIAYYLLEIIFSLFSVQIRRMQDMLTQMQEKLKQSGQDTNKKHDSIIDV